MPPKNFNFKTVYHCKAKSQTSYVHSMFRNKKIKAVVFLFDSLFKKGTMSIIKI